MALNGGDVNQDGHTAAQGGRSNLVVVLDTDPGVRWALEKGLRRSGYDVRTAGTAGEALRLAHEEPVAAMVLELLPEAGLTTDVLVSLLEAPSAPRIVCVSVEAEPKMVIECVRCGAADFLPKPFGLAEVRAAIGRALASGGSGASPPMRERNGSVRPESKSGTLLIGISPATQELRTIIQQVAATDLNCLIRGESGTGKDMVAREIHRLSVRADRPFVKVNCTALPDQLLESELFGYEKGAFTGAATSKPGRFELANKGIIFLDEIGELHHSLQAKLLQVIEHKEFTKLGGTRHLHVDVQIIAATNADLETKTREGSFRDDLYFRLNEVCIWVPPLSARKEDIPLLVRHFARKHGDTVGGGSFDISGEDLASLTEHPWPGNVRELESTIKRWLALGNKVIAPSHPGAPGNRAKPAIKEERKDPPVAPAVLSERDRILDALERHQWNRRKAAQDLGVSYQTLRRRIEKYGFGQTS